MPEFVSGPPPRGRRDANSSDHDSETAVTCWQEYFNIFPTVIFQGILVNKRHMAVSCKCSKVEVLKKIIC